MLHPATAHFAIVLPIVASVFGLVWLITKQEIYSKLTARTTALAALALIGVWYTGSQDGPEIYNYLSEAGQATLLDHKTLGLYLAVAMTLIALIHIAGCKLGKRIIQTVGIVLLLVATATTLFQGKLGGELVYEHGTPFKSYLIMDSLKEATMGAEDEETDEAKVEVYEDALDDITMHSEEIDALYGVVAEEAEEEE